MKHPFPLLNLLFALFSLFSNSLPAQLAVGVIDQNEQGVNNGFWEQTFETSLGPVTVLLDVLRDKHQFILLENDEARVLFETELDNFNDRISGIHNNFVLLEDWTSSLPVTVAQVDLRTGERRNLFSSDNGLTFSVSIGQSGYAYLDQDGGLRVTNGTEAGTFEVASNVSDAGGFAFGERTLLTNSVGIYITDGTEAGTSKIFGEAVENPQSPFTWNDLFFIPLPNGLIVTDGTAVGTRYLIVPDQSTFPSDFVANDEGVFFVARNTANGREAWQTDGTPTGTRIIRELAPGPDSGIAGSFTVSSQDGQLVFQGGTTETNNRVYLARVDSLQVLLDLDPAIVSRSNYRPAVLGATAGGTIFLTTHHTVSGRQTLWRVRPGETPVELGEFRSSSLSADQAVIVGESLFYQGGASGLRLYFATSTATTTTEVDSVGQFYDDSWLVDGGYLYYAIRGTPESDFGLRSLSRVGEDGVVERYGVDIPPYTARLPVFRYDGGLAAYGDHPVSAEGFYRLDDVGSPTFLADILPYTGSSSYNVIGQAGKMLYVNYSGETFVIRPGADLGERVAGDLDYRLDFTQIGNQLLFNPTEDTIAVLGPTGLTHYPVPAEFRSIRSGYTLFEGAVYFLVHSSNSQNTRYHFVRMPLDNQEAMTSVYSLVSDDPLDGTPFAAREIAVAEGMMYLAYPTFANGWELGRSDGTTAGTVLYRDLVPGAASSTPRTVLGNDGRLVVRTRAEVIGNRTLYLELLNRNQSYWYEVAAFNDRPFRLTGNDTHTFIGLRVTTSGNDGALIINDANGATRETVLHLNSPFFPLADGRVAYHVSNSELRVTTGPVATDQTLADVAGSEPNTTALFGEYFLHIIGSGFGSRVGAINLVTGERLLFNNTGSIRSLAFYPVGGRAYFPGETGLVGRELFYLTETGPRRFAGRVYEDRNGNGTEEAGEPPVEGVLIEARGDYYTQVRSGADGRFSLALSRTSDFTVSASGDPCYESLSSPSVFTINVEDVPTEELTFGVKRTGDAAEISATVTTAPVRCGTTIPVWLTVRNTGCASLDATLNFRLPEDVTYVSATEEPTEIVGTTLHWALGVLPAGADRMIRLLLEMPDESRVGQPVDFRLEASGSYDMDRVVFDEAIYAPLLRCAIDPNDKLVQPARPEPSNSNYTQIDERLSYTIRFQNTGNDTAINVRLEDQLAAELDLESFKPVAASHDYRVELLPTGLLNVFFDNIMLPDSNVNQVASNGFFAFEMGLLPEAIDTLVRNTAGIFFDFNAPVITNTTSSSIVEFLDQDGDGFNFWEECDDTNRDINPDAFDIAGNGIDENCDYEDSPVSTQSPLPGELEIYPNPAYDQLTIRYSQNEELIVRLFDGRGRRMQSLVMRRSATLKLEDLPAGVYFVSVYDEPGEKGNVRRILVVK